VVAVLGVREDVGPQALERRRRAESRLRGGLAQSGLHRGEVGRPPGGGVLEAGDPLDEQVDGPVAEPAHLLRVELERAPLA
jgi:hypothetical protein